MFKADIGDFLYIIIFAILMLAGGLEKFIKAKKQQQDNPRPPQPNRPYDDFEDVEDEPAGRPSPPQTLEEMVKRMLQVPEQREKETAKYPEEAQSLEVIPEPTKKDYYQPVRISQTMDQSEKEAFSSTLQDDEPEQATINFKFDIRQAVIASEILNRKY